MGCRRWSYWTCDFEGGNSWYAQGRKNQWLAMGQWHAIWNAKFYLIVCGILMVVLIDWRVWMDFYYLVWFFDCWNIFFVFVKLWLENRSWKLAPQRRSQCHMCGQIQHSNATAVTALYDHGGSSSTLHNAGSAGDAGDAVMVCWLYSK